MSLQGTELQAFQTYMSLKQSVLIESENLRKCNLDKISPEIILKSSEVFKNFTEYCIQNSKVIDELRTFVRSVSVQFGSLQFREIQRIHRRFSRVTKLSKFPVYNEIKLTLNPCIGISAFDTIPLELEINIFRNLPTIKDMVRWSGVSQQRRAICHDIQNWRNSKVFQGLLTGAYKENFEGGTFLNLLELYAKDPSTKGFARSLALEFFNKAHDEALRKFLMNMDQADFRFFFEILKDSDLNRKSLSLGGCFWIKGSLYNKETRSFDDHLPWLLEKLPNLERLSLSGCGRITDQDIDLISKLTQLRDLKLWGCPNLFGNNLELLANLKKLENLDISECTKLKGKRLRKLVGLTSLKTLDISGVPGLRPRNLAFLNSMPNVTVKK